MLIQHPLRPWLNSCLLFAVILSLASAQTETPKTAEAGIHLRHILIADTEAKVLALQPAADAGPVVTKDMPALATKEFADFIAPYLSQAVTTESINRLARTIGEYLQKHDRPVVNVQIPTQNIADGNFRLVVAIGRYKQLQFKGNRWFSRELLEARARRQAGRRSAAFHAGGGGELGQRQSVPPRQGTGERTCKPSPGWPI
jgi:hemolysin activation/secretion protein